MDSEVIGLGLGRRLFDIPVYRVSREQWTEEREEELTQWVEQPTGRVRARLLDIYGEYAYNQIMGLVQLVRAGSAGHVKGYYFQVSAKRIGRRFRQQKFTERGKIIECRFYPQSSSAEIMQELRVTLTRTADNHRALRGRYLDLEVFDSLAPALDARKWLGLDEMTDPVSEIQAPIERSRHRGSS